MLGWQTFGARGPAAESLLGLGGTAGGEARPHPSGVWETSDPARKASHPAVRDSRGLGTGGDLGCPAGRMHLSWGLVLRVVESETQLRWGTSPHPRRWDSVQGHISFKDSAKTKNWAFSLLPQGSSRGFSGGDKGQGLMKV